MRHLFTITSILFCLANTSDCVFGQVWVQTSAPNANWVSVASSADGNRLAVINYIPPNPLLPPDSPIYLSTNSGATWTPPASVIGANDWGLVACSADGYQLLITTGYGPFCLSTNGGLDWLLTGPFSTWNLYPSCVGLSSSADGNKLAAVFDGFGVYTSQDSGNNWAGVSLGQMNCVASSADGAKLIAGRFFDSVYRSTDSGATWEGIGPTNELWWGGVASSADGCKLVAVVESSSAYYTNEADVYIGGPIYTSTDSGATWTQTSAPIANWNSVASSADGTELIASQTTYIDDTPTIGGVYTSTNSGATWQAAAVPMENWQSVAVSADGNRFVAVATDDAGIWIGQSHKSPELHLSVTSSNLTVSWIIPSTNFVLQQNCDLSFSNWVNLTNQPVLNLTNLQNQVTLPAATQTSFFRLVSE